MLPHRFAIQSNRASTHLEVSTHRLQKLQKLRVARSAKNNAMVHENQFKFCERKTYLLFLRSTNGAHTKRFMIQR